MLPLYTAITGGLLAWYHARKLKKEVKGVPWAEKAYDTLYDAEEVFTCTCGGNLIIEEMVFVQCDKCGATDYQAEGFDADDDWKYNLQPQSILQSALGYGVGPKLYYARADSHAYTMAYNEGHKDARNKTGYKPDIDSRRDVAAFRDAYKLRAESEIVSHKKKGKVISLIGSDPRLRKLKKDKYITPEEASQRTEISAESTDRPKECLFCDETDAEFIEVILDGYPELICEHCVLKGDLDEWAAENWGGDPEGTLAKALDKARATLKNKLNITKLPHKDQKSLDEFNGAVVWKEPKGIVEKVMVREMALQQLRLNDAILELEQYIKLGMISEEDAFRKIVAMSQ